MDIKTVKIELEDAIKYLLLNCPLYGDILINVKKHFTNNPDHTASITADCKLTVGIPFWATLTKMEKVGVLVHECNHVLNDHFTRFKHIFDKVIKSVDNHDTMTVEKLKEIIKRHNTLRTINICLDCAINQIQHFGKLPEWTVDLEYFNSFVTVPALAKQSAEYYYNHFNKYYNKKEMEGDGDDHFDGFFDLSDENVKKLKDIVDRAKIRQREFEKNSGRNPGEMEEKIVIDKSIKSNEKLWKSMCNKICGDVFVDHEWVYGKPSRKSIDSLYGKTKVYNTKEKIVIMDTSGSVESLSLAHFCGHMNHALKKYEISVDLFECDASIRITRNLTRIPSEYTVVGRGGTDLTQALQQISEMYNSNIQKDIIVMTDGYTPWWTAEKIRKNRMNIVALYTPNHQKLDGVTASFVI